MWDPSVYLNTPIPGVCVVIYSLSISLEAIDSTKEAEGGLGSEALAVSPRFFSDDLSGGAVPAPEFPHLGFFSRFNKVCLLSHGPIQENTT